MRFVLMLISGRSCQQQDAATTSHLQKWWQHEGRAGYQISLVRLKIIQCRRQDGVEGSSKLLVKASRPLRSIDYTEHP